MKTKIFILNVLFTFCTLWTSAQFGMLDSSFATNGIYTAGNTAIDFTTNDIYGLNDGSSYSVTSYNSGTAFTSYVRKLKADGTRDSSFGSNGVFTIPNGSVFNIQLKRIHRLSDGTLLVAGNCTISSSTTSEQRTFVAKVLADGSGLDNSFGTNGAVNDTWGNSGSRKTNLTDLNVRFNGKIVLTGDGYDAGINKACPVIMQLNADGSLDNSFGFIGVYKITSIAAHDTYSNCAHEDGLGNFYLGGYSAETNIEGIVFKVNPTGSGLVTSYNSVGYNYPSSGYINDIEVNGSNYYFVGNRVVSGTSKLFLVQQNQNGVKRNSFGINGVFELTSAQPAFGRRIHVRDENEVVVGGYIRNTSAESNFLLFRLDNTGSLDNSFGINGALQIDITPNEDDVLNGLFLTSNGKIFTCGEANDRIGITRHNMAIATRLNHFHKTTSIQVYPNPFKNELRIQSTNSDAIDIIQLLDYSGRLVFEKKNQKDLESVQINSLPKGFYLLKLSNQEGQLVHTQSLIKN